MWLSASDYNGLTRSFASNRSTWPPTTALASNKLKFKVDALAAPPHLHGPCKTTPIAKRAPSKWNPKWTGQHLILKRIYAKHGYVSRMSSAASR
jgi:hypothetical protein